jgi:hypothetical protein
MTLIQRFGYYLGGFAIGLVLLAFFLSGKKTSCSYGLDARVLKNIQTKTIDYGDSRLDSLAFKNFMRNADVNFSKSNTKLDSCKIYFIEGYQAKVKLGLLIENCDSIARILKKEQLD